MDTAKSQLYTRVNSQAVLYPGPGVVALPDLDAHVKALGESTGSLISDCGRSLGFNAFVEASF